MEGVPMVQETTQAARDLERTTRHRLDTVETLSRRVTLMTERNFCRHSARTPTFPFQLGSHVFYSFLFMIPLFHLSGNVYT